MRSRGLLALFAAAATLFAAATGRKEVPAVNPGGVVNGASFEPAPNNVVAPLSIVSIFGIDLALRTEVVSELSNNRLPLTLGGVSVIMGGQRVPLFYVSPNQVNAQIPENLVPRPQPWTVQVVREGLGSPSVNEVHVREAAPGVFPQIRHADDNSYVGRNEAKDETPARPGEILILVATGLGPTSPPILAGELYPYVAELILPYSVQVGDRRLSGRESILYAGIAPNYAGLYQINLRLPDDLPGGDHELIVEVGGASSQRGLLLPVGP